MKVNTKETAAARCPTTNPDAYKRTRDDHAREIAEDYIELIDDLIGDTGEARAAFSFTDAHATWKGNSVAE